MNDQLTFDDLRAYQAGLLSGPARHRVERILLEDPFYADALSGLEAMHQTALNASGRPAAEQLADLRSALHQRIHASANKKRLWPLWIATTTAAILFMLAVAIYFIFFAHKQPTRPAPASPPKVVALSLPVMPSLATKPALASPLKAIAQRTSCFPNFPEKPINPSPIRK